MIKERNSALCIFPNAFVKHRFLFTFRQNQKELSLLRDRLDIVDSTQRHQLDELKGNSALFNKPSAEATAGDKYCEEVTRDKENLLY